MKNIIATTADFNLSNGVRLPALGLGVLRALHGVEELAVTTALAAGYRLVDTAAKYGNEAGVGRAIRDSGTDRREVFLTSKVWNTDQGYAATRAAFAASLEKLGTDYLDLYLIHWPVAGQYRETWRALEDLYREGRARAIGVSNFQVHHLEDLRQSAEIMPMVNQVELHPWLQQTELREYAATSGILLQAWRPIMMGRVLEVPELVALGERYGKTPVQITLRYLYQLGVAVIPKSATPYRIRENADIFDFTLSPGDMAAIAALNRDRRLGPDPDNFAF